MSTYGYPDWSPARDYLSGLSGSQIIVEWELSAPGAPILYTVGIGKTFVVTRVISCLSGFGNGTNNGAWIKSQILVPNGLSGAEFPFKFFMQALYLGANSGDNSVVVVDGPIAIQGGTAGNDITYTLAQSLTGAISGSATILGVELN